MIIHVKRQHIVGASKMSPTSCPIAKAIKDALLGRQVVVGSYSIFLFSSNRKYKMPRSVQRFIARFDDGKSVKPFRFRISDL